VFEQVAGGLPEGGGILSLGQLAQALNVQPVVLVDRLRQIEALPEGVEGVGYVFPVEVVPGIAIAGFIAPGAAMAEVESQMDQSFFGHPIGQSIIERLTGLLE